MPIDDEMAVGAQRVEARGEIERLAADGGQVFGEEPLDSDRLGRIGIAIDASGSDTGKPPVCSAAFSPCSSMRGKP